MSNFLHKVAFHMIEIGMSSLNEIMAQHGKKYELREDENGKPIGVEISNDGQGRHVERIYHPDEKKEEVVITLRPPSIDDLVK